MKRTLRSVVALVALGTLLAACTQGAEANARRALAEEIGTVRELFENTLEKSAETATDALSEKAFTELGQDFRVLNDRVLDPMPRAPLRGVVDSTITDRHASVVMLLSTRQETGGGLFSESSYAYICLELSGMFDNQPMVSMDDADCGPKLEEKFASQAWDRFLVDDLQ